MTMKRFECMHKGSIYTCELSEGVYGGVNVTIYLIKQGREPKAVHNRHVNNMFKAMMEMEKYLPDANWEERT